MQGMDNMRIYLMENIHKEKKYKRLQLGKKKIYQRQQIHPVEI